MFRGETQEMSSLPESYLYQAISPADLDYRSQE